MHWHDRFRTWLRIRMRWPQPSFGQVCRAPGFAGVGIARIPPRVQAARQVMPVPGLLDRRAIRLRRD